MDWSWAVEGITEDVPRTTGPECLYYMTNRRRWIESLLFTILFMSIIRGARKNLGHIVVYPTSDIEKPHSTVRLMLMIAMTFTFGIEMGFKFASKSAIFVLNPCHIQTIIQIYLLAAKPSKITITLFRIQMNNLNGPFLAFLFPEVESRTLPFEQATYWVQHALLYIIPVYILKTGAYQVEDFYDYNWTAIGVAVMLSYHFIILNALSMFSGINLSHMLCAAVSDPFQGPNYRIAAVIHEAFLCPILNKATVYMFGSTTKFKRRNLFQDAAIQSNEMESESEMKYRRLEQQHRPSMATPLLESTSTILMETSKRNNSCGVHRNVDERILDKQNCTNGSEVKETAPITMTSNCLYITKND